MQPTTPTAPVQHTPGPWHVIPRYADSPMIGASGSNGDVELATVHRESEYDQNLPAEANARLMAAAPDLLKALTELWQSSRCEPVGADGKDCWLVSPDALTQARAAIAKATR